MRRNLLAVVAGVAAIIAVGGCQANSAGQLHADTDSTATASSVVDTPSAAPSTETPAAVGETFTVKGQNDGEQIDVTLLKVTAPVTTGNEFEAPDPGKRYVGFLFKVTNTGTATYQDAPDNSLTVYGSDEQSYEAAILSGLTIGQLLGNSNQLDLPPGQSVQGWLAAEMPNGVSAARVQFAADSGFAQYGVWQVG